MGVPFASRHLRAKTCGAAPGAPVKFGHVLPDRAVPLRAHGAASDVRLRFDT